MVTRFHIAVLLFGFALCSRWAMATEPPPALPVEVRAGPVALDPEQIRAAVAQELGVAVVAGPTDPSTACLEIEGQPGPQVTVRYRSPNGVTSIERTVALPVDAKRQATVVAWVAGNLARNEAAELLATFKEPPAPESPVVADPKPTPPPAKPEPGAPAPAAPATPRPAPPAQQSLWNQPYKAINLTVLHPFGSLYPNAPRRRFWLHLGLAYGRIGELDGLGVDVVAHQDEGSVNGVTAAGIWTEGHGTIRGLRASGIGSREQGALVGAEASGLVTLRNGSVTGASGAGIYSRIGDRTQGMQVAGVACTAQGRFDGVQACGATSLLFGDLKGVQGSAAFNQARDLQGAQVSMVNTANDVTGFQFGLVNVARRVNGMSFGLVNVAERVDGMSLGLVNVVGNMRTQALVFYETPGYWNMGVRYLFGHLSSSLFIGHAPDSDRGRLHFGLGGHWDIGRFTVDAEGGYNWVVEDLEDRFADRAHALDARVTGGFELVPGWLGIFVGPTVDWPMAGTVPLVPHPHFAAGLSVF